MDVFIPTSLEGFISITHNGETDSVMSWAMQLGRVRNGMQGWLMHLPPPHRCSCGHLCTSYITRVYSQMEIPPSPLSPVDNK
ncbi:mCG148291 [Mus musculus]|nr:mCG148291 [Mus musculus]